MNWPLMEIRVTRFLRFWVASVLACISMSVWATGGSCSGGGQTVTLALPATVSVPRDAAVGSLLTAWVQSPAVTNYWSCNENNDNALTYMLTSLTPSGVSVSFNGTTRVFNTNVPGIGLAIAGATWALGGTQGWNRGTGTSPYITNTGYGPFTGAWSGGSQVAVALVKTAAQLTVGGTVSSGIAAYAYPATSYSSGYQFTNLSVNYVTTPVQIVPLTCTTPDVNVAMGTFKTTDFPNVGSLSPNPASFTIQILNCPAGTAVSGTQAGAIHTVQYRIDPTNGTAATNVAALSGSPSATGVGIQLFNSAGTVFPLSTLTTLSGYNSTSGGNYSIPMTARYYRTGTVTAGPGNTTMTLTMSYQ
ncbi:fimbrial protein [Paraburkholderia bannensis]|uniref:fimbrial protein n=1 Tax=Paraburkholderia bannensis TaxID=765414 RepID=UPI002AB69EC9|nr:fimbrial protein [Paraburkholderia bannensis]